MKKTRVTIKADGEVAVEGVGYNSNDGNSCKEQSRAFEDVLMGRMKKVEYKPEYSPPTRQDEVLERG